MSSQTSQTSQKVNVNDNSYAQILYGIYGKAIRLYIQSNDKGHHKDIKKFKSLFQVIKNLSRTLFKSLLADKAVKKAGQTLEELSAKLKYSESESAHDELIAVNVFVTLIKCGVISLYNNLMISHHDEKVHLLVPLAFDSFI